MAGPAELNPDLNPDLGPELTLSGPELAPELADAFIRWRAWLQSERRYSEHTLTGYDRDLTIFLDFMTLHLVRPLGLDDLAGLKTLDFRAYLADRRGCGRGGVRVGGQNHILNITGSDAPE